MLRALAALALLCVSASAQTPPPAADAKSKAAAVGNPLGVVTFRESAKAGQVLTTSGGFALQLTPEKDGRRTLTVAKGGKVLLSVSKAAADASETTIVGPPSLRVSWQPNYLLLETDGWRTLTLERAAKVAYWTDNADGRNTYVSLLADGASLTYSFGSPDGEKLSYRDAKGARTSYDCSKMECDAAHRDFAQTGVLKVSEKKSTAKQPEWEVLGQRLPLSPL